MTVQNVEDVVSGYHLRAKETSEVINLRSTIVNCVKVLTNYVTWVAVNTVKCCNTIDAVFFKITNELHSMQGITIFLQN